MSHDPIARRRFLGASLATASGIGLAGCAGIATQSVPDGDGALIASGDVVLFQGDSITDAGRSREHAARANRQEALGKGYAWLAAAGLLVRHESAGLQVFNRGISGHKVFQLADRWQRDCLDLQPDVLSILIGVNDIWHTRSHGYDGTVRTYERDYDALLTRTRAQLPRVKLVICEPFVLRCGAIDDTWFPEFDEYRAAARRIAAKHRTAWVPFQSVFDQALEYAPPAHWAEDGVHPSHAGAALMAQTWLDVVAGTGAAAARHA